MKQGLLTAGAGGTLATTMVPDSNGIFSISMRTTGVMLSAAACSSEHTL